VASWGVCITSNELEESTVSWCGLVALCVDAAYLGGSASIYISRSSYVVCAGLSIT